MMIYFSLRFQQHTHIYTLTLKRQPALWFLLGITFHYVWQRGIAISMSSIISYEWGKQQMAKLIYGSGISAHLKPFECHRARHGARQRETESKTRLTFCTAWLNFPIRQGTDATEPECQAAKGFNTHPPQQTAETLTRPPSDVLFLSNMFKGLSYESNWGPSSVMVVEDLESTMAEASRGMAGPSVRRLSQRGARRGFVISWFTFGNYRFSAVLWMHQTASFIQFPDSHWSPIGHQ